MVQPLTIPSSSVEYVKSKVTGSYTTLMPVQMAIVTAGSEPTSGDYVTAAWDGTDGDAYAKVLIGTGTTVGVKTEGLYGVWVKITATPEIPVIHCGQLRIA